MLMDRKILLWVVSLTLVALALAIFSPGGREPDKEPKLPWDIQLDGKGGATVFGLTLGQSTLNDASKVFSSEAKVSLFITGDEQPALEAYFERIYLSGLRADFVLVLDAESEILQQYYARGNRISRTTESTQKVDLTPEDKTHAGNFPIKLINYIPAANLEEQLLLSRFGEPAERMPQADSNIMHWIYPETGLSIAVNPDSKELLQYIQPKEMDFLIDSLSSTRQAKPP
jgi:hypothetical protein